jgi:hypothetical protein
VVTLFICTALPSDVAKESYHSNDYKKYSTVPSTESIGKNENNDSEYDTNDAGN